MAPKRELETGEGAGLTARYDEFADYYESFADETSAWTYDARPPSLVI